MKHILIITSFGPSLINFRLPLIKEFLSRGYRVSVASPGVKFSEDLQKILIDLGVNINIFSLSNTTLNVFKDFKTILEIFSIIKKSKPNIIISYTVKPTIYTGLVLKFFKQISFFPLITGLGYVFIAKNSTKHKILKYLITNLYRVSLKSSAKIIFQNKDDQKLFYKLKIVEKKKLSDVVNGSGVDLKLFPVSNLPLEPVFLMISRLLFDKGVREYVEAAKIVRSRYPFANFN
jgi:hypothetical protein